MNVLLLLKITWKSYPPSLKVYIPKVTELLALLILEFKHTHNVLGGIALIHVEKV